MSPHHTFRQTSDNTYAICTDDKDIIELDQGDSCARLERLVDGFSSSAKFWDNGKILMKIRPLVSALVVRCVVVVVFCLHDDVNMQSQLSRWLVWIQCRPVYSRCAVVLAGQTCPSGLEGIVDVAQLAFPGDPVKQEKFNYQLTSKLCGDFQALMNG